MHLTIYWVPHIPADHQTVPLGNTTTTTTTITTTTTTRLCPLQQPECGVFLFLNSNYNLRFATRRPPPSVDPSGYALKHQLPMLTHVIRERKMWPPGLRSKPAVDPRKVETGSVHVIQKLREGKWFVSWRYF